MYHIYAEKYSCFDYEAFQEIDIHFSISEDLWKSEMI